MRSSQLRQKNENINMFSNSNKPDNLKMYKFGNDYSFTDISEIDPNIVQMSNDHKKYNFTAPDEDCHLCSIFNGYPVMATIGSPEVRFLHYEGKTGTNIPFKRINDLGEEIESGSLIELDEGFYYHVPSDLGLSIYIVHGKSYLLKVPYITGSDSLSGKILLQKDKWQLLAVPIVGKVYEDFIKKVEDKYNVNGSDIFEAFNAYPATDSQNSETLSFIPGVTNISTKHNFALRMTDINGEDEILGFWCKTKNYDGNELVYDWSIV